MLKEKTTSARQSTDKMPAEITLVTFSPKNSIIEKTFHASPQSERTITNAKSNHIKDEYFSLKLFIPIFYIMRSKKSRAKNNFFCFLHKVFACKIARRGVYLCYKTDWFLWRFL